MILTLAGTFGKLQEFPGILQAVVELIKYNVFEGDPVAGLNMK